MTLTMKESAGAGLTIAPLGPHTGAAATGLDLRHPVDADTRRRLQDALRRHVALVIRDQKLETADQFAEAIRIFGNPMQQNFKGEKLDKDDVVKLVSNEIPGKSGQRVYHASYWHTDHTNRDIPPAYTALYPTALPRSGGDTGVVNTRAAYANLPAALKAKIEGLKTVNVYSGSAARNKSHKAVSLERAVEEKPIVHPLIVTDPVNGEKAIYLHQGKLENFVGMSPEASHELVGELMPHIVKPEFVYRHKWRLGDLLIWDDRASMHQAYTDYDLADRRVIWRIIVEGRKPA